MVYYTQPRYEAFQHWGLQTKDEHQTLRKISIVILEERKMKTNVFDWLMRSFCFLLLKCPPGKTYLASTGEEISEWAGKVTEIDTNALLNVIPRKAKNSRKFPSFLSYYAKKVFPDKIDEGIAQALEHHIEAMEPQFRSASFSHLWHALTLPLTGLFRPKGLWKLSHELQDCLQNSTGRAYKYPKEVDKVKTDLIICRIGRILDAAMATGSGNGANSAANSEQTFVQLRSVLREPLTQCLQIAGLSNMLAALVPCFPRFELAGIQYKLPSKLSDIQRDVVICKVDEIFNEVYDKNALLATN